MKKTLALVLVIGLSLALSSAAPAQPAPTGYTLNEVYYYLVEGTEATWGAHSLEPQSGVPGGAVPGYGKSLADVYDDARAEFGKCGAAPGQVRDTVAFFSTDTDNWGPQTGTIATQTLSDANDTVAEGFYEATTLSMVDADLETANIKSGVTVFGVAGDPNVVNTSSGDAAAGDVMSGKKAWVDGGEVTGTIATRTLSAANDTVQAGYYAATTLSAVDADLATANIKSGVTVFGVAGDPNVVNTSSGDAAAGDIKSGKKAWADGAEVTGTIATRTLSAGSQTVSAGFYEETTLSGVDADLAAGNIKSGATIFGVAGSYSGSGGGLLKTGQTTSYRSGDDGTYQKGTAFSYQTSDPAANGEIVTTDNITGLMWASDGSGAGCNWGSQTTWNAAIDWAEGLTFAGYSDWRLPNRRELESIVDSSRWIPAINTTYFPNTVSDYYWSGSTYASNTTYAWHLHFNVGFVYYDIKTSAYYVRAVHEAQVVGRLLKTGQTTEYQNGDDGTYEKGTAFSYQTSDPAANGEIVTTDNVTGLMWASNGSGAGCYSGGTRTWSEAITWAEGLTFAGYSDWRLPNITELQTLFVRDAGNGSPYINTTFFPNTVSGYYCSSTTDPASTTRAMLARFDSASVPSLNKDNAFYVRAVRGDTSTGVGRLLKTGQTTEYLCGDDGTYEKGTAFSYQTSDPAANGEIVTTDHVTGLMWASDGSGAGCYSKGTRTWSEAIIWAESLTFAGYSDWRLPNITELQTLFVRDAGIGQPRINTTFFPNTVSSGDYWSSTTVPYTTATALVARYDGSYAAEGNKISANYVRAVRGGE